MAVTAYEAAYELERFAPKEAPKPRVKVAKNPQPKIQRQTLVLLRNLALALVIMGLAAGVLYTHARQTELQSAIAEKNQELVEQNAMSAYLNNRLEGMANLTNIEQRANELGLVRMDPSHVSYVRVEDGEHIEVAQSWISQLFEKARDGFLYAADFLEP